MKSFLHRVDVLLSIEEGSSAKVVHCSYAEEFL